jgi:hypothetical protein
MTVQMKIIFTGALLIGGCNSLDGSPVNQAVGFGTGECWVQASAPPLPASSQIVFDGRGTALPGSPCSTPWKYVINSATTDGRSAKFLIGYVGEGAYLAFHAVAAAVLPLTSPGSVPARAPNGLPMEFLALDANDVPVPPPYTLTGVSGGPESDGKSETVQTIETVELAFP